MSTKLSIVWVCVYCSLASAVMAAPTAGDRLSAFSLITAESGAGKASTYTWKPGRVTILTFCAFWCDTWKGQTQRLAASRRALQGLPVEYLMIAVDGRWSEMARGMVGVMVLLDTGGKVTSRLGVNSVPYTVVIDGSGTVRYAAQGIIRNDVLQRAVRAAFNRSARRAPAPVYLTFDNFPGGVGSSDDELLDVLRRNNVRATFFCTGERVASNRAILARAAREGHSLQVSGWSYRGDGGVQRTAGVLRSVALAPATLWRAPGRTRVTRLNGGKVQAATINPYDHTRPGTAEIARRVINATHPGQVIYLHAGVDETIQALPQIIRSLRGRGLAFGVLR